MDQWILQLSRSDFFWSGGDLREHLPQIDGSLARPCCGVAQTMHEWGETSSLKSAWLGQDMGSE